MKGYENYHIIRIDIEILSCKVGDSISGPKSKTACKYCPSGAWILENF
jgi:hypothetical protein